MNNKNPSPSAILCYAPEDDWLAHGIADSIEEKEFYIQLSTWCVHDVTKLWQKIREATDNRTHFLVLLTQHSAAKMWPDRMSEDEFSELIKSGKLVPVAHCMRTDDLADDIRPFIIVIGKTCDVDCLVEHIKKLNTDPDQPLMSRGASDSFPKPSAAEIDAQFIVQKFLFLESEFKVEIAEVVEKCKWDKTRLDSAINWLKSRGLVKIEGSLIVGKRPSIDCFKNIIMSILKNNGIAGRCHMARTDTLLLKREKFEGKIFNDKGSFDIQLTANADRSGKIVLEVEPVPRSLETERQLLFVYSGKVNLDCVGVNKRNRKLTGQNVQFRGNINKDPVPIWLEPNRVVITDKSRNTDPLAKNTVKITLFLSEFDCLANIYAMNFPPGKFVHNMPDSTSAEPVEPLPAPYVEGLGFLTLEDTFENSMKNRTNKRITAFLSITAVSKAKNLPKWKKGVRNFLQRLIPVLEFAQGGNLFCPITELCEGDTVETTFLRHGESARQFMPVLQRGKDLKNLIIRVIEKQKLSEDKWKGIEEAISFALSAPNYGEARLLLNLIAIERLVKTFGGSSLGELKSFLESRNISSIDIENGDIKKLVDNRNSLAHEGKFTGDKNKLVPIFALSHEVISRIILSIFDFSGWYCSYTCERGVRSFPECKIVDKTNVNTLKFLWHLHRWKDLVKQKDSRVPVHLPS